MGKILTFIDKLNNLAGKLAAGFCLLLIGLTVEQVIARYFFNAPSNGLEELKWHIFGIVFLLSLGFTYQHDGHVRVDVWYQNYSPKNQALINFLGQVLIVIPFCLMMIYFGIELVGSTLEYANPKAKDHFSSWWFPNKNVLYHLSAAIESWLRATILVGEISDTQGGLEARWIIKAFIPLGFLLLGLQSLALAIKYFTVLRTKN